VSHAVALRYEEHPERRYDGQWLDEVTSGKWNRGERGKKKAAGAAPIKRVVDWLKTETGGVVSAVAFTVEAKK
jgi:hypothetical protein